MSDKQDETGQLSISSLYSLTHTEWKVLMFIARDLPNADIAQILSIEIKSVHNYRSRIGDKLNVKGYSKLGCLARRNCNELQKLYNDWHGNAPSFHKFD
ncbi:helix-turn-helix transcriptional regulator [Dyadobacter sp. 3J3]|uniref:helix-turn-helix transcriptional regulator n=1 Tax=Dyadobacter sp. 3J3 TaxID=2606600 RepID=UPI00135918D0|nr:helix-turn-helix transcriptional regulator [Dyadobacter sp. 3J3]